MEIKEITKNKEGNIVLFGSYFHVKDLEKIEETEDDNNINSEEISALIDDCLKDEKGLKEESLAKTEFNPNTMIEYDERKYHSICYYPYSKEGMEQVKKEMASLTRIMIAKVIFDPKTLKLIFYELKQVLEP